VHDAIEIERHGIPCAVVGTEPFVPTMQMTAVTCGIADYPMAIIRHPIGSLMEDALAERADEALSQVLKILLSD
jgi:hypothetical protein